MRASLRSMPHALGDAHGLSGERADANRTYAYLARRKFDSTLCCLKIFNV